MVLLQILISSVVSLVILFILTKIMGNKQISQLSMFDYIIGITIGSIAAELATDLEDPVQPATAMIIYGIVAVLISYISTKSNKARAFFAGKPIILMTNGRLSKAKMKKARLDVNELLAMARIAGFYDLSQIETAIFEQNGNVSFLPKSLYRPATPDDMKLPVKKETLPFNVIVDGKVMERELSLAGKDPQWLREQLRQTGYKNPEEVFLASVSQAGKLSCFAMEEGK